ncbi:FecR family protein [Membranihabitans maritimus]|uniref:FecR family protein n=1 Tax=Membranihabitans maritimus TaxID=2904244 RepID=UPI001F15ECA1|nr:FecR domain-containing protein [Membranihabitans maritimus]
MQEKRKDEKGHKERMKSLYEKLVSRSISKEELAELYAILGTQGNNRDLDKNMLATWEGVVPNPKVSYLNSQIESIKNEVRKRSNSRKVFRIASGVAASIVLIVASIVLINLKKQEVYYSTDYGERKTIQLPDRSVVQLNANSTIKWDNNWEDTGIREAFLSGEAFFEVRHLNKDQKFVVHTDDLNIEVLGTSFNVSKRDTETEVYLEEGKVEIGYFDKINQAKKIVMTPGQRVLFSKKLSQYIQVTSEKNNRVASWKDDVLYFEDQSVKEILEEVSQIYGIEYVIPDTILAQKKMNFAVPYTEWEPTKEAFELTMGLNIVEKKGKFIIQKR